MAVAQGFLPAFTLHGGPPAIQHYAVKASQTIKRGYPLRLATTSPGSLATALAAATGIFGIAAEPITTTATEKTTRVAVWLADPQTIFEGRCTGTGRPEKWVGKLCDFVLNTSVNYRVSATAGSYDQLKIVGIHPDDLTGTGSDKRIRFTVAIAQSQIYSKEVA
mgnify:CR=1 FL=1